MKRIDRELLEDALKLIEYGIRGGEAHDITEEIRARLAEPEDKPFAWFEQGQSGEWFLAYSYNPKAKTIPLYRHPRQPMRLSDLEISGLMNDVSGLGAYKGYKLFAEKIMDAMLEKNQ